MIKFNCGLNKDCVGLGFHFSYGSWYEKELYLEFLLLYMLITWESKYKLK